MPFHNDTITRSKKQHSSQYISHVGSSSNFSSTIIESDPQRSAKDRKEDRTDTNVLTKTSNITVNAHRQIQLDKHRGEATNRRAATDLDLEGITSIFLPQDPEHRIQTPSGLRALSEEPRSQECLKQDLCDESLSSKQLRSRLLAREHEAPSAMFKSPWERRLHKSTLSSPPIPGFFTLSPEAPACDTGATGHIVLEDDDEGKTISVKRVRPANLCASQSKQHSGNASSISHPRESGSTSDNNNTRTPKSWVNGQKEGTVGEHDRDGKRPLASAGNNPRKSKNTGVAWDLHTSKTGSLLDNKRLLSQQKNRSMPSFPSGPKPINKLGHAVPASSVVQKPSKTFDLTSFRSQPEIDSRANKRQKTQHASGMGKSNSVEIIDDEAPTASVNGDRRPSIAPSGFSNSQNGQTRKTTQGLELRKVRSRNEAETFAKPRSRVSKRNSSGAMGDNGLINGGSTQFKKQHSSEVQRDGELKDDPIASEDDLSLSKGTTKASISVEISSKGYQGSANLRPARTTTKDAIRSTTSRALGEKKSPYFLLTSLSTESETQKRQSSKSEPSSIRKSEDLNDSVDDLSKDHYSGEDLNIARNLLPASRKKVLEEHGKGQLASKPTRETRYEVFSDLDSDEEREKKVRIKASVFKSKNLMWPETPDHKHFQVSMIFSEQTLWLVDNPDVRWGLIFDTNLNSLNLYKDDGEHVWEFFTNALERLEFNSQNSKFILRKRRDYSSAAGIHLHFELDDVFQKDHLRDLIRTASPHVSHTERDHDQMDRIFEKKIGELHKCYRKRRVSTERAPDIMLIEQNVRRRQQQQFDDVQEHKRLILPATSAKRDKEYGDQQAPTKNVANAMRSRPTLNDSVQIQEKRLESQSVDPGAFYGAADKRQNAEPTRSTRASERALGPRPPVRSPSPPPRWTELNPDWANGWKASLVYPREGIKKATVDMQDIPRLDEGEYLNDNLIAFYLQWLEEHLKQNNPGLATRIYFQNTFFYERLAKNPPKGKKVNYEAVQRWTAKINLLDYDYIVIPVNENQHWYVAIIFNARKLLPSNTIDLSEDGNQTKDEENVGTNSLPNGVASKMGEMSIDDHKTSSAQEPIKKQPNHELQQSHEVVPGQVESITLGSGIVDDNPVASDIIPSQQTRSTAAPGKSGRRKSGATGRKVNMNAPRIIILDSLGLSHPTTSTNLRDYLVAEIKTRTGVDIEPPSKFGHTAKHLPQQTNYCDCGLFLLMYIEMFLQKGDDFIHGILQGLEDVDLEWTNASALRSSIRNTLLRLQKEQIVENDKAKKEKARKRVQKDGKSGVEGPSKSSRQSLEPTLEHKAAFSPPGAPASKQNSPKHRNIDTIDATAPSTLPSTATRPSESSARQEHEIQEVDGAPVMKESLKPPPRPLTPHPSNVDLTQKLKDFGNFGPRVSSSPQDGLQNDYQSRNSPNDESKGQQAQTPNSRRNRRSGQKFVVEIQECPEHVKAAQSPLAVAARATGVASISSHRRTLAADQQGTHDDAINLEEDDDAVAFVKTDILNHHVLEQSEQQANDAEMLLGNVVEDFGGHNNPPVALSDSSPTSTKKSPKQIILETSQQRSPEQAHQRRTDGKRHNASHIPDTTSPTGSRTSRKRKSAPSEEAERHPPNPFKSRDSSDAAIVGKHWTSPNKSEHHRVKRTHMKFPD